MPVLWQFLNRHPILAIGVPLAVGLAFQALVKDSEWIEVYVGAARVLVSGGDIYASGSAYWYPPFMAFATVPFVPLAEPVARLGWYVVSILSIVGMVRWSWRAAGGSALPPLQGRLSRDWQIAAIGVLIAAPFALNTLAHQQVDLMIDALIAAGCLLLLRGHHVIAAVLIGLASACKGPPLLFALYLLARRDMLGAAVLVAVAAIVNLLPDLLFPLPGGEHRLLTWIAREVLPSFSAHIGAWNADVGANQSIAGTIHRLASAGLLWTPDGLSMVSDIRAMPPAVSKGIGYALMLVLLVTSFAAALRGQRLAGTFRAASAAPALPGHTALELSTVAMLMLMLSPMTGLAHLGVVVLPGFVLARIMFATADRAVWIAMIVAVLGALMVNKDLVGSTLYTVVQFGGVATWTMAALWLGCVIALARGYGGTPAPGLAQSIFGPFGGAKPAP
jgi:hypothetical protein